MTTPTHPIPPLSAIQPDLERLEGMLHEIVGQVEEPLRSALARALDGGKRLRPAMVLLIARLFSRDLEPFLELAAAVDMLHAATLIHDDVVDHASLRRGHRSLHTVWPAGAAVLAGDYLLAEAIALVAGLEHASVARIFAATLRTMCAGEIRVALAGPKSPSRADCYRSIEAKTAALLAAAAEMAGLVAGAAEPQVAALRRFGHEFGIAFQIVDDVLDLVGDEAELGKPVGADLRQGLATLPVVCYLEQAGSGGPVGAVLAGQRDEAHLQAAIEAIRASGAIEQSLGEARAHARQSQEALIALPDSRYRQALSDLAIYVVERRR